MLQPDLSKTPLTTPESFKQVAALTIGC